MAKFEHKQNSGSLFKNDKREKDTHPHAKGTANIGGVLYWVSAWTKETKGGDRFQSLSFTPMENQPDQGRQGNEPAPFGDEPEFDSDSIPF